MRERSKENHLLSLYEKVGPYTVKGMDRGKERGRGYTKRHKKKKIIFMAKTFRMSEGFGERDRGRLSGNIILNSDDRNCLTMALSMRNNLTLWEGKIYIVNQYTNTTEESGISFCKY